MFLTLPQYKTECFFRGFAEKFLRECLTRAHIKKEAIRSLPIFLTFFVKRPEKIDGFVLGR
jgi:hypothetical protein